MATIQEISELAARKIVTYKPESHEDMVKQFADFVEGAIREANKPLLDGLKPFADAANYHRDSRAKTYKVAAGHCRSALELFMANSEPVETTLPKKATAGFPSFVEVPNPIPCAHPLATLKPDGYHCADCGRPLPIEAERDPSVDDHSAPIKHLVGRVVFSDTGKE